MKVATVYGHKDNLYIHSSSKTTTGVWILTNPVLVVQRDDFEQIGKSVKMCLQASEEGVPHPSSMDDLFTSLLKIAGVGSYDQFAQLAKCVEVEMTNEQIVLIPMKNSASKGGFVQLLEGTKVSDVTDEGLGKSVLETLSRAE